MVEAIVQNSYVVRDLETSCAQMNTLYGIGPFVGGTELVLGNHRYRGAPAEPIRLRVAFAQAGDLNIELVQLVSEGPDAFRDVYPEGGEGFHHVAIFSADVADTLDRFAGQGFAVASAITAPWGGEISFVDARSKLGHMIEVYPEHERIRSLYSVVRQAALDWDGRELIVSRN
jgi:hypothetical protein